MTDEELVLYSVITFLLCFSKEFYADVRPAFTHDVKDRCLKSCDTTGLFEID